MSVNADLSIVDTIGGDKGEGRAIVQCLDGFVPAVWVEGDGDWIVLRFSIQSDELPLTVLSIDSEMVADGL